MIYTNQLHFCTFVFTQSHNHTFDLLLPLRLSNEDTGVAANPCCSAKPVSDTSSCEYVMLCVMRLGYVAEINTPHTRVMRIHVYMRVCTYMSTHVSLYIKHKHTMRHTEITSAHTKMYMHTQTQTQTQTQTHRHRHRHTDTGTGTDTDTDTQTQAQTQTQTQTHT